MVHVWRNERRLMHVDLSPPSTQSQSPKRSDYFSHNNFDLIRLVAATQVTGPHGVVRLEC